MAKNKQTNKQAKNKKQKNKKTKNNNNKNQLRSIPSPTGNSHKIYTQGNDMWLPLTQNL
jgi:hypothetical protein